MLMSTGHMALMGYCRLTVALFCCFTIKASAQSKDIPLWYKASYKYESVSEGVTLLVDGVNGDRGVAQAMIPFLYHTWQLNVHWPGQWTMTVQSLIFHENGSTAEYTYWHQGNGPFAPDGTNASVDTYGHLEDQDVSGCSPSVAPTGDALDGLNFDWMGEVPDLAFLGNETLTTDFKHNVTVQHWASPSTCRDVYLLPLPPNPPWSPPVYVVPAKFTVSDPPSSGTPGTPSWQCTARVRSYEYMDFQPVSFYEAGQDSGLWRLPSECLNSTFNPGFINGAAALQAGYVQTVWLGVGCALSAVVGAVGSLLWSFRRMKARRMDMEAGSINGGGYRLMDVL